MISDSILFAASMAADGSLQPLEGFLPQIERCTASFYPRTVTPGPDHATQDAQTATGVKCHRVVWEEFEATTDQMARLNNAWDLTGKALRQLERPGAPPGLNPGNRARVLDAVTRALCAVDSPDAGGEILLVDSGSPAFRWAMLAIGAEFFDTVILWNSDLFHEPGSEPGLPEACTQLGRVLIEQPERLLGVSHSMATARVLRHMSGVPTVTLESVRTLASRRRKPGAKLTIVVPTLGHAGLEATLQSISKQHKACQVEVLVMVASRAHGDARPAVDDDRHNWQVMYVKVADQSPYEAMNAALNLATSQWIYFLGCGDTLADDHVLQRISSEFASAPAQRALIYGNVRMEGDGPGAEDGEIYAGEFSYDRLRHQNICHQSIFYRLATLRDQGGFDSKYTINADWAINLKLWNGVNPHYCDLVIANFVRGGLSTTGWDAPFFSDLEHLWMFYDQSADN